MLGSAGCQPFLAKVIYHDEYNVGLLVEAALS